jgi:hypothetical protein
MMMVGASSTPSDGLAKSVTLRRVSVVEIAAAASSLVDRWASDHYVSGLLVFHFSFHARLPHNNNTAFVR